MGASTRWNAPTTSSTGQRRRKCPCASTVIHDAPPEQPSRTCRSPSEIARAYRIPAPGAPALELVGMRAPGLRRALRTSPSKVITLRPEGGHQTTQQRCLGGHELPTGIRADHRPAHPRGCPRAAELRRACASLIDKISYHRPPLRARGASWGGPTDQPAPGSDRRHQAALPIRSSQSARPGLVPNTPGRGGTVWRRCFVDLQWALRQ